MVHIRLLRILKEIVQPQNLMEISRQVLLFLAIGPDRCQDGAAQLRAHDVGCPCMNNVPLTWQCNASVLTRTTCTYLQQLSHPL
jgi:hypothetical protein